MNAPSVLALNDLRILFRDRAALFWIFVFPAVFALFLASIMQAFSARSDILLEIAVFDRDRSPAARAYLERLRAHPALRMRETTREVARAALERGTVDALVGIERGFGENPYWYSEGAAVLTVFADPSRRREARYLQGLLLEIGLADAVENELTSDPRAAVRIDEAAGPATPTPYELAAPAAIAWGLIGSSAAFAIAIASERQRGMLRRLRALPIRPSDVLFGKALACLSLSTMVAVALLVIACLGFGVRLASPHGLAVVVLALSLCFTGLMAMISTFGKSERAVAGAGWATLLMLAMLGGAMAPRMILPDWLRLAGMVSPVRWGIVALESVLWRGGDAVAWITPSIALVAVGLGGLAVGAMVLRRSAV